MVNHIWPRIYLVSFSWNGHSYHIYSGAFALSRALVHRRCPSVVMFILLQPRPSRLIGLQYSRSAFISVSRLVNIPVGAFGRGLPIILLFNLNLESFGHDLGHYAQSSSLSSCLNCLSWCHSVTVSREAVLWLSLAMRFGDYLVRSEIIFGLVRNCFGRHNRTRSA